LKRTVVACAVAVMASVVGCADLLGFKSFREEPPDGGATAEAGDLVDAMPADGGADSGSPGAQCDQVCGAGQVCQDGECVCEPSTCAGCCTATTCSTSWPSCGLGGGACTACDQARTDRCDDAGACVCGSGAPCPADQTCVGGACTCKAATCAGTCCNDVCVQTATSSTDCGACGHSCLGGPCSSGVCQPVTLATDPTPGYAMTLSSTTVFWTSEDGIYSCPLAGCGASPPAGPFGPAGDVYGTNVTMGYWDQGTSSLVLSAGINSQGLDVFGMTPDGTDVAGVELTQGGWMLDDGLVYWFDGANVSAIGVKEQAPRPIMSSIVGGVAMAADIETVYVATGQSLLACPKTPGYCGTTPVTISLDGTPTMVATEPDAANVYFANETAIYRCPSTGCPDPSAVDRWTGPQGEIGEMATDSDAIYWTDSQNGWVLKCAHGATCGSPTTIASGLFKPLAIAVDDTWVYWTLGTTVGAPNPAAVQRVPK
jgi:hypothetical protein